MFDYTIKSQFELGQEVYVKTEEAQRMHMVTAILLNLSGNVVYQVGVGPESYFYFGAELSETKNFNV